MARTENYVGIQNDVYGGMTAIGKLVRDAWVFGILDESETCEGWSYGRIDALLHQVNDEWDKYGCLVGNLPADLKERHRKFHEIAIKKAKEAGWSGELETEGEK
jgi:hypothetical protein